MKYPIEDNQTIVSVKDRFNQDIRFYDDGFGDIYIHRDSMGITGIVRAQTWEGAYSIVEDEFMPEANETIEELIAEYGFKREHVKMINDGNEVRPEVYPDDYTNGKLKYQFIEWKTIETPDPDAWMDNELFQEAYGFRPNGKNSTDKIGHGIYAKDLNGDRLDLLTVELAKELQIEIELKTDE